MKYLCLLIALFANAPIVQADAPRAPRVLDMWAGESLERGLKRSRLFRDLVGELEVSNLVIHIESSTEMPFGISGITKFVTSQHGYRYVRIVLDRHLLPDERAAVLGHELQHACEIARSTADNKEAIRTLFQGFAGPDSKQKDFFETRAAVLAGRQVAIEIRKGDSRTIAAGLK